MSILFSVATADLGSTPRGTGRGDSISEAIAAPYKKVLLVAFDFPPRRTGGVYRPVALTRYLLNHGWQATVLTPAALTLSWWTPASPVSQLDIEDQTLMEKVPPKVHVLRTGYVNVARWDHKTASTLRNMGALRPVSLRAGQSLVDRLLRSLGRWVRSILYFPDPTIGWVPFAVVRAIREYRRQRYDLIYTTSPPRSGCVVGLSLKWLLRIPWVLEFRDPWFPPPGEAPIAGHEVKPVREKFERWLLALLLRHADVVVAVTPGHAQELQQAYRLPAHKVAMVRNGFDEEDFRSTHDANRNFFAPRCVHLSHFGTIYPGFSGSFFSALAELVRESPEVKNRLRIHIFGYPDADVTQYASQPELQDVVQLHSFVKHTDALKAMRSSHFLLLFYAHRYISRACVPGKIYEYLRSGRPILAITYEGGVQELIEKGNAGFVLRPDDEEAMKQILRTILGNAQNDPLPEPPQPEFAAQFRYDRLARNLARILEGVVCNER